LVFSETTSEELNNPIYKLARTMQEEQERLGVVHRGAKIAVEDKGVGRSK